MKKEKIFNKIQELKDEAFMKSDQVRELANIPDHFDAPKIRQLCEEINITLNVCEALGEFLRPKKKSNDEQFVRDVLNKVNADGSDCFFLIRITTFSVLH